MAAGGACGAALAAAATGTACPPAVYAVLPAAIWVVYTLDHLLDARRLGAGAHTFRHAFHVRHARPLAAAVAIVAAAGGAAALAFLPGRVIAAGLVVGAGSALHLVVAGRPRLSAIVPKEISAAAMYTAGVWCAPLAAGGAPAGRVVAAVALFFVAALANLLLNALLEAPVDAASGAPSWALTFGPDATARAIDLLALAAAIGATAAAALARFELHGVFAVLLLLGVLPAVLLRLRRHVEPHERYRAVGDLAFLLAVIPAVLR